MFQSITLSGRGQSQVLVLAHFQGQGLDARSKKIAGEHGVAAAAEAALKRSEATGDLGTVVDATAEPAAAPKGRGKARSGGAGVERVLIVGLGAAPGKDGFKVDSLRSAAAAVGRKIAAIKATSATVEVSAAVADAKVDGFDAGVAFGEAVGLLGWVCDHFKGKGSKSQTRGKLALRSSDGDFNEGLERGLGLAESTNFCRTLSQTPPNVATTSWMANEAKKLGRKTKMAVKVFEGSDLVREKFEGLINVGKASENKPCMVRIEYNPPGRGSARRSGKPLVLVGKTMTYDTGGLSLKVNNGMVGMKRDKDGGCAVLGAMHAIATVIKPKRRVIALLAIAENSISDEAYRPDDVLTFRNGVTVEVTNTDAEGRLVMADALCWACDKENPAAVVDIATLTGGVVVALGSTFAGLWCEDDSLRGKVEQAAGVAGERVWRLPLHQEYKDMMKSPVADIVNSNPNRKAHPIQGAAFLSYFVQDRVPWCHLDIAGVHATEKNAGPYIDGPTGWGVRTLANLAEML